MGPKKSNTGLIAVLVGLVVVALVGVVILVSSGGDDDDDNNNADGTTTTTQSDEESEASVPTVPEDETDLTLPTIPDVDPGDVDAGPPDLPPSGDDAAMDAYADDCYNGDMVACDDLYKESEFGSNYEAYGDTCGGRVDDAGGQYCVDLISDPELP